MELYYLKNDELTVGISYHGAEIKSVVRNADSREYMWCGDAKYWGRTSPVLFPFVGKVNEGTFRHEGIEFSGVPQHGYARDCDFVLAEETDDTVWFALKDDEEFYGKYPFHFTLRIGYKLEGKKIHVMWTVINDDNKTMYFSIGAHPAFNCPILGSGDDSKAGYKIDLHVNANELLSQGLCDKGLVDDSLRPVAMDNGVITLSNELFDGDALIFDSTDIHTATIIDRKGEAFLSVHFDTPLVGIWSPVKKAAPFVCIEPWYGRCDSINFFGDLKDRAYGNTLEAGHSFNKEYIIEIH